MCLYKSSVDGVDLMEALFDRMFALPMIIQLFVIELYAVHWLGPKELFVAMILVKLYS